MKLDSESGNATSFQDFDRFQIVAFDVFDTLLFREVPPENVKKLWAKQIVFDLNLSILPGALYKIRFDIEAKLSAKNHEQFGELEFSYDLMTQAIFEKLSEVQVGFSNHFNLKSFHQFALKTETEIEKYVTFPNMELVELAKRLKQSQKELFCISDFYLPATSLESIFEHHGILYPVADLSKRKQQIQPDEIRKQEQ